MDIIVHYCWLKWLIPVYHWGQEPAIIADKWLIMLILVLVLRLVSDTATANTRMTRALIVPQMPGKVMVVHKLCDMHTLNHAAEAPWNARAHTPMFYSSGFN